jgi:Secretion system C-terminal sorting domain
MKHFLFILMFSPSNFILGQNYFNTILPFPEAQYVGTSILFKSYDTLVFFGGANYFTDSAVARTMTFVNPSTGIEYRHKKIGDAKDYKARVGKESIFMNNHFYLVSTEQPNGDTAQPVIQKISAIGELIWEKKYDLNMQWSVLFGITQAENDTIVLIGNKGNGLGNDYMRFLKIDTNGNVLSEKNYTQYGQYGGVLYKFTNGTYLTTASTFVTTGNYVSNMFNLDCNGNILWQYDFGGLGYGGGNFSVGMYDSTMMIAGQWAAVGQLKRPRIVKLDRYGNELWNYVMPEYPGIEITGNNAYEVNIQNEDLSYTLIGRITNPLNNRPMAFMQNITKDGVSKWFRTMKIRTSDNYISDLLKTVNKDFIVSGFVFQDSITNTEDGWLMRMNCIGLFEGPKDSVVVASSFENVTVTNFANHFAFSILDWGDGTPIENIESNYSDSTEQLTFSHTYTQAGDFTIQIKTIACNDTLLQNIPLTVVKTPTEYNQLVLFPNPNSGNFTLGLSHEGDAKVTIYENTGKIVYQESKNLNGGKAFNFIDIAAGLYHIIVEADGNKWRTKWVKE